LDNVTFENSLQQTLDNKAIYDYKGIYLLHNTTKNKLYIGQTSTSINARLKQHFVEEIKLMVRDYYQGDEFVLGTIQTDNKDLSHIEMLAIEYYKNKHYKIYNKTRGNL